MGKTRRILIQAEPREVDRWIHDAESRGLSFAAWARICLNKQAHNFPVLPDAPAPKAPPAREAEVVASSGRVSDVPFNPVEERERARVLAVQNGRCTADVPQGVRCKLCGAVHKR